MNIMGKIAEDHAVIYVRRLGYRILARNFYTKYGEIDILAYIDREVVCFEVKASTSTVYDSPGLRVNRLKILKIQKCFEAFISRFQQYEHYSCRIDVIAVYIKGNTLYDIQHFKNVQLFEL